MGRLASLQDHRRYPRAAGALLFAIWLPLGLVRFDGALPALAAATLAGGIAWWTERLHRDRRLRGQDERDMGMDYRA